MTNREAIEFLKNMIDREAIGFVCPEREGDVAIWQYHVEALQMAIFALQAQEWIPVSERLPEHPENDDYYLVTIQCEHCDGWDDYVTGFAEWTKHGWDEMTCYIGQIKVVAWKPLPEPYREEDTDVNVKS